MWSKIGNLDEKNILNQFVKSFIIIKQWKESINL